jgi:S1-C subfamily serine protease
MHQNGETASMTPTDFANDPIEPRRFLSALALLLSLLAPLASPAQEREAPPGVDQLLSAIVAVRAQVPESARTAESLGTERVGSGIVIDSNGLIVTIGYLILEARHVEVTVADGEVLEAAILAYDHETGIGLLRAKQAIHVTPMRLGESAGLARGARLLVSGYGGRQAARPAVLVSRRDFAGYWEYLLENAIFTAPPYPLFGGAALVNADGELVGIGSLVVADAFRGVQPLPGNMFVPVDRLKSALGDLMTTGRSTSVPRPWLGIYLSEIDGLLVVRKLAVDGPAAGAGIQPGDIVIGVAGEPVGSMADFYRKLWSTGNPGDEVALTVLKGARLHQVDVIAGDRYKWLHLQ